MELEHWSCSSQLYLARQRMLKALRQLEFLLDDGLRVQSRQARGWDT